MAPQIAHKHHRRHGKLALGLSGAKAIKIYHSRLPFVGNRSTEAARGLG